MAIDRSKYMDAAEVNQLIRACRQWESDDLRYGRLQGILVWALVDTALQTGLRVSELAALKAADFNPKQRSLKVVRLKKKKKVVETMPISKELAAHLKEYIGDRKTGTIFQGKQGDLKARGLQAIFKRAIQNAHLPDALSIHSCRHTLAVMLLRKTQNLRLVQKTLGHSSPSVTAVYADVAFDDQQAALDGLYE